MSNPRIGDVSSQIKVLNHHQGVSSVTLSAVEHGPESFSGSPHMARHLLPHHGEACQPSGFPGIVVIRVRYCEVLLVCVFVIEMLFRP